MKFTVEILGCRGSLPASGARFAKYGGATSCVSVRCGERSLIFDAGTGIMSLAETFRAPGSADLFLTHAHVDHTLGLMLFPGFFNPEFSCNIYGPISAGAGVRGQLDALMRPPLWPVGSDIFRAKLDWRDITSGDTVDLGGVRVSAVRVAHPGGTVAYRTDFDGRSFVYAPDIELDVKPCPEFEDFARGCELLMFDASYTDEEYARRRGFGHSTVTEAAKIGLRCGAARTLLTHHAPMRADSELDRLAELAVRLNPTAELAAEGMKIEL